MGVSNPREFDTRMSTQISFRSLDKLLSALAYRSEVASVVLNLYRYLFPKSVQAIGQRDMGELTRPCLVRVDRGEWRRC
jgi:hypothetical protein